MAQIEKLQKSLNEIQTENLKLISEKEALKSKYEKADVPQNASLDVNVEDELKLKSKLLEIQNYIVNVPVFKIIVFFQLKNMQKSSVKLKSLEMQLFLKKMN